MYTYVPIWYIIKLFEKRASYINVLYVISWVTYFLLFVCAHRKFACILYKNKYVCL